MKSAFRFVFSVVAFAFLIITQLPESGHCACCATNLPVTQQCPMIKTAVPRDFVAASAPVLKIGLVPLGATHTLALPVPRFWSAIVSDITQTIAFYFVSPQLAVRAPPLDYILFSA